MSDWENVCLLIFRPAKEELIALDNWILPGAVWMNKRNYLVWFYTLQLRDLCSKWITCRTITKGQLSSKWQDEVSEVYSAWTWWYEHLSNSKRLFFFLSKSKLHDNWKEIQYTLTYFQKKKNIHQGKCTVQFQSWDPH